jgi:4-diphosphocytidyl-2-C-methyl-D-erythritol kinase
LNYERKTNIVETLKRDIKTWKTELVNDFEQSVFKRHPQLENIKNELYQEGAVYAAMSGSGSTLFGLFKNEPVKGEYPISYNVFIGKF